MNVNPDRLANVFKHLVEIDSLSRNESAVCADIRQRVHALDGKTLIDNSAFKTGSDTGNLLVFFEGRDSDADPLILNAHMDTVGPGRGVRVVLKDGVFTSAGETILGADDKSAIAILLEVITIIKEKHLPHGPLELVFTTCEEIGLLGARHLDTEPLRGTMGYALDTSDINSVITRAPAARWLQFKIHGKAAHAGVAPEEGINAIALASKAIASQEVGRIDPETTANIGVINGGRAANIVPDLVTVSGEVRSHDDAKLERYTRRMVQAFQDAVAPHAPKNMPQQPPYLTFDIINEFPGTHIPDNHPVIKLAQEAAANLGRQLTVKSTGGCADANIFFQKGLSIGVIGTGMRNMHTIDETIRLDDMVATCHLVLEIIRLHSKTQW